LTPWNSWLPSLEYPKNNLRFFTENKHVTKEFVK
jgi:hypothetical protein